MYSFPICFTKDCFVSFEKNVLFVVKPKKKYVFFEAATATERTSYEAESANNTKHYTPSEHNFPRSKSAAQEGNFLALAPWGNFQAVDGKQQKLSAYFWVLN